MADWGGHFIFICIKVIFSEYHVVKRWNGHTHENCLLEVPIYNT